MLPSPGILAVVGLVASLAACGEQDSSDQNIAVDNIEASSDVDVLPPDESSATPSDALVNGTTDDPGVTTPDNQTDSY